MVQCDAATPAHHQDNFLKPCHLPVDRVDQEANFHAHSNIGETRFHRGFHRRHKSDIMPDAARLEVEVSREHARESRARSMVVATREHKSRHTFNILTGEGEGRDCEFKHVGKKVLNPYGCQEAVFGEHARDASNRTKNSKHRFFEHNVVQKPERMRHLFEEGLTDTVRQTAILGYGQSGVSRTRAQSCGLSDNFAHINGMGPEPDYELKHDGNSSQIMFG